MRRGFISFILKILFLIIIILPYSFSINFRESFKVLKGSEVNISIPRLSQTVQGKAVEEAYENSFGIYELVSSIVIMGGMTLIILNEKKKQ